MSAAGCRVLVLFVPSGRWVIFAGLTQIGSFSEVDGSLWDPWPSYRPSLGDEVLPLVDDWRAAVEFLVREHTGAER